MNSPLRWTHNTPEVACCAFQSPQCTIHRGLYTIDYTPYTTHCTLHTVHNTLYTTQCTLHTVHYKPYTTHCTQHNVHYTLYTTHCTLHTVHYTLYTTHCSVQIVPISTAGMPGMSGGQNPAISHLNNLPCQQNTSFLNSIYMANYFNFVYSDAI